MHSIVQQTFGGKLEMENEKKDFRKELFYTQKNGYDLITTDERALCDEYCEGYKRFLNDARTERECVSEAIRLAEEKGFVPYERGMALPAGTKIYRSVRGKALMLAVIGTEGLENGANIAAAHVDSPRLDLKQLPLYEDSELCYFKTHYYGGIKKYQWTAIPLELHGVVALKNGETVDIVIGREKDDPVLLITDLLPHLAADQYKKTLGEAIPGESLNLLIGSVPYADDGSDRVKLAVMSILADRYGITEEDFLSAELEAVPAMDVRDLGLDRSMIAGYGHDDRVCAYAELAAIFETEKPRRTAVCILADKEEIGSEGVSGMQSHAFECFMDDLCASQGVKLTHCFEKSLCISADVCNGYDPNYPEVSEKRNNAKLNYGLGICKFTGSRGKSGSNDASAEIIGYLRRVFADNGVVWQMAELGKVDQGGGGTVAMFMSRRNIDTIDAGVPVLSMHAPYETVSKFDCYMTYKGVKAVYAE
jgi:aspartyl aminopeptidase